MTDILNELTEIPFDVFWDKWQELKPGIYNRDRAEKTWFYMVEANRVNAFSALAKNHPMIQVCREPYQFLEHFDIPFHD
jgi:hypothetical protein